MSRRPTMKLVWSLLLLVFYFGVFSNGDSRNASSRPAIVNIGALFTFNSTIGRVAKVAMETAIEDVNSNSSVLGGSKLSIKMRDTNCSGFIGIVEALEFMETDVVAMIGPQSSVIAHVLSHVASELQVPLLSFAATDPTLSSLQFPFFVRMTQSDLYQMVAIADIVDYYGWREVVAIYIDDDYGRNGITALGGELARKRCRISYKQGIPPILGVSRSDILDLLVKVAVLEFRVVVLHVNPDLGLKDFSVAQSTGMMRNGYAWIATDWLSLDSSFPLPMVTMDTMQGVLALRQHIPDTERKISFFTRWKKLTGGSLGLHSYGMYAYDTVWLIAHAINAFFNHGGTLCFFNDLRLRDVEGRQLHLQGMSIFSGGKLLLENILHANLSGLTGPVQFNSDRVLINPAYDVINVIGTGFRTIGYWSNYSGLSVLPPETLYIKPPNRSSDNQQLDSVIWPGETTTKPRGWVFSNHGKHLRIGVPIRASFRDFVTLVRGTEPDTVKGFCIDVFTASLTLLPYAVTYDFIPYGDGLKNPSYTKLVNMITTNDFDAVVGDIAIVTSRAKIVDFTQPYIESGLNIVAPVRKLSSGGWAFLRPFTLQMWFIIAAVFLFVGIVVWILEHRMNNEFRGPPREQLITVLWFSFSTLFFAHRQNTVSTLGHLVLILWLFVVLIISSSYTASLTSILTVQHLSSPIKGIESLITSKEPIGFQVGSFTEHYLSEELGISRSRLVPLGSPEEFATALERGPNKGGVAAVVDERPYVDLLVSSHCKFRVVGEEFTKSGWGFAFPRDSSLAVDFSSAILILSENGDLQRIRDKWLPRRTCSSDRTELESDRLQFKSFWGLYLLCGIALLLALLIFFVQTILQFRRYIPDESDASSAQGSSWSRSFQTFLSFVNEKEEEFKNRSKRRKWIYLQAVKRRN